MYRQLYFCIFCLLFWANSCFGLWKKESNCILSNSTHKIDFTKLRNHENKPRYIAHQDNVTYFYTPCQTFTSSKTCKNVYMCKNYNESEHEGLITKNNYTLKETKNIPSLSFNSKIEGKEENVEIKLICEKNESFSFIKTQQNSNYIFSLKGPLLCAKKIKNPENAGGISTGSVLCIIFFIGLLLYLIIGFCFKRFVMGAQGIEQIPNIEFWRNLPGLVKDGCIFTKDCLISCSFNPPVRGSSNYNPI